MLPLIIPLFLIFHSAIVQNRFVAADVSSVPWQDDCGMVTGVPRTTGDDGDIVGPEYTACLCSTTLEVTIVSAESLEEFWEEVNNEGGDEQAVVDEFQELVNSTRLASPISCLIV